MQTWQQFFARHGMSMLSIAVICAAARLGFMLWRSKTPQKFVPNVRTAAKSMIALAVLLICTGGMYRWIHSRSLRLTAQIDRASAPTDIAVLFVHGWHGAAISWQPLRQLWRATGGAISLADLHIIDYPTVAAEAGNGIVNRSSLIADYMISMKNYKTWIVIAHSLGGVIIRNLAVDYANYEERLVGFVSLGSPLAGAHISRAGRDLLRAPPNILMHLAPDSDFIQTLSRKWNSASRSRRPFHICIASVADAIVPFDSATHYCDQTVRLDQPSHNELIAPSSADQAQFIATENALKRMIEIALARSGESR